MTEFSDYIIYVDESGDHGIECIDEYYPIFALVFCLFRKSEYVDQIVPSVQKFKFKWLGHDMVILHERDIRRAVRPFAFLPNRARKDAFMTDVNHIIVDAPVTVISAVIRKDALSRRYLFPKSPYHLALLFCLERAREFLVSAGQGDRTTHVICEARGEREDHDLELEFRRIESGEHILRSAPIPGFSLHFADKRTNSSGLQMADLMARPIGLAVLRPDQPNRAAEIIKEKIWQGTPGALWGDVFAYALKVSPKSEKPRQNRGPTPTGDVPQSMSDRYGRRQGVCQRGCQDAGISR